jgi:hypothetical protein
MNTVRDRLSVYLQGRGWLPPIESGTAGGLWRFPDSDWMLPVPNELVVGGSDWQQIIERIALAENITTAEVEKSLSSATGLLGMTERQAAAWPEYVARLNRAVEWVAVPEDIQNWSVKWDEEVRPGRGRGLNATYLDGEVFAQIILDVYGYGSESVAELSWVHASADEECRCAVCKAEGG